jgi:hypothetical protein
MGRIATFDRAALAHLLAKQDGVVARQQIARCAMSEGAMRHRIRPGGPWQVLLPGIYLSSTGTPTAAQRQMAGVLFGGPLSVITGPAALALHGIRPSDDEMVDVLVPLTLRRQNVAFLRLHRTSDMPGLIFPVGQLRFAPPARAVADTVRGLASIEDVRAVVAAAVQRGKAVVWHLAAELERGPVHGSALFRLALSEVAEGVRSSAEADLRTLIKRARLPEPIFNPRLFAGNAFLGSPDAWWPDAGVAGEVDSREWHLSPQDWERTLARQTRMSARGIIVLHFTPRQVRLGARAVAEEIRSALQAGRGRPALRIQARPAR